MLFTNSGEDVHQTLSTDRIFLTCLEKICRTVILICFIRVYVILMLLCYLNFLSFIIN